MDEYDKKFAEMQKYIPFLEAMIERLQNVKDKDNREVQLQKMQSLHGILSNSKRKLKIETLQRCEDVLQKLHNRVEKGNTPCLQLPTKRNDGVTPQPSTSSEDAKSEQSKKTEQLSESEDAEKAKEIGETPASPDTGRSSSPDCQILPIIIPTEWRSGLPESIGRRRQTPKIIPVITLTERTRDITISSPTDSNSEVTCTEWEMLEESERRNAKSRSDWPSLVVSDHDVATAAKLVSSNLPQKASDSRNYSLGLRNVPTVPVPSLGGSRRLTSVLEKNKLSLDMIAANVSRPESPVNVPEVRLKSPDPEILFAKPRVTSPRPKDNHNVSKSPLKPPSIPLLLSPPPFSSEPPLSMEDLAELLNDENDGEKKNDRDGENTERHKNDSDKQETIKDGKVSKSFLLPDRENEKRREDIDRHNIKVITRKCSPNVAGISPVKSNEFKGPPYQSNEHRLAQQVPFTSTKFQEPRYADNYERHPRQRDAHGHESTKDKLVTGSNIPEEASSQIPVIHNTNSLDERNNPLYQRRPIVQQDGRKDTAPPRSESEFMIEGIDYYNMHMNQLHWPPSTATSDHQFGNAQWTPPAYGMANPSLQPTQHPYQHTIESQFRPNQFSPNLPTGPRSLINPASRSQDINHVARPENIREDMSLRSPPGFPVTPQYRGFQMSQGSYDSVFVDRPTEYSHVRPTWEESANRSGEVAYSSLEDVVASTLQKSFAGTSYVRPNTPCPWGTRDRDRGNRGRGKDGYYERNRMETRPGFNRDVRRSDWPRDNHSDRENPNRFPNRDPRMRTEHNVVSPNQTKETGASARDPRLAKDKHVNTSTKVKDTTHNERDPRKRMMTAKMMKEKAKSQRSPEKADKLSKDRMQSPLESLYGVIDTKASQSSGLQKFKIPKIKRPGPPQPKRVTNETKNIERTLPGLLRAKSDKKSNNNSCPENSKDDASAEVSSSSDGNYIMEDSTQLTQDDVMKEGEIVSLVDETDKNEVKIGEADSVMDDKSNDIAEKGKKGELELDGPKPKEEVTQEWIEALIKKSFESGEGKKLVEAKLKQKLEALKAKKLKKIKKIIESESESSSSDKNEVIEAKKIQTRKKRRVIVSDSSDDECLAERLGILNTSTNASDETTELTSAIPTDPKTLEEVETIASDNLSKELVNVIAKENEGLLEDCGEKHNIQIDNDSKNKDAQSKKKRDKENNRLEDSNENTDIQPENSKHIDRLEDSVKEKKQTENNDKIDQISVEKPKDTTSIEQDKIQTDCVESATFDTTNSKTDEISSDKPKAKTKRRNSLEMLQEDIREMFISDSVVTATGYRMCRLSKEIQPTPGMSLSTSLTSSKKDEVSNTTAEKKAAEPTTETDESTSVSSNIKVRKKLRPRNSLIGELTKQKTKKKKDIKRTTRNLRSKESIPSSGSEEDQPLALRTEKLLNNTDSSTSNQDRDCSEEISDALRRSKRVLRKETVKEPRVVVEKTDITKIDSSKGMFDSSSDESFGIDIVGDVSLRQWMDKQSDQDSVDTNSVTSSRRRKTTKNAGKRYTKSKKVSSLLTDDKSEDGMSITDEESIISDISMSSNTTVGKKTSGGAIKTSAKEELLSNILVGLVPTTIEKNTLLTDKGNEADFEDSLITEMSIKKSSVKKKKKKSSWQMGIVSTKKRKKKTASVTSSKTAQISVEVTNIETNVSTETVENDRSISEDNNTLVTNKIEKITSMDNHTPLVDDTNIDSIVKCDEIIKPFVNTDLSNFTELSKSSNAIKKTLSNESLISIEENKPAVKMEVMETPSAESTVATAPSTVIVNKFFKDSSKIVYDELMTELFCKMDAKQLMNYAWTGQDKYKCLLCIFTGKNIVHHYKINHPGREVLIARLKSADAEIAIAESSATAASAIEKNSQVCKFRCRFCYFVTEGAADVALEAFYEHCTTHTGEYRFHCNSCSYQAVAKASMRTHYYKMCRKHNDTFNESATEDDIPKEDGVYGYLCRSCNYVQLKRHNIEAHVTFWHQDKLNTEIVKINMSAITGENITSNNETSQQSASANAEESFITETKPKVLEFEDIKHKDVLEMETVRIMESQNNIANSNEECVIHEPKAEENIQIKEEGTDEKLRASQGELEGSTNTGNLSAFVSSPELENKEVEIQRERQKMMQEIANNIGILGKNSKPGLSIIDKLQDKMRTDTVISPIPECNTSTDVPQVKENFSLPLTSLSEETLKFENNVIIKEDLHINNQEDSSVSTQEQSITDKSKVVDDTEDKADVKIRDPLAIMDPCNKGNESDGETSENERSAPVFESDSSSEQSDSESTDVNMILKETSSMNASSSRDGMLTTIQRLAAQLQNAKPLESVPKPVLDVKIEIKSEPVSFIPKPPDVVPIASVKHLLTKQLNVKHWEMETLIPTLHKNASPPKNFIRLRRLSGDMLSVPTQLDNSEDIQASNTDETQSKSAKGVLQTDTEEECSFLKIENVVSLARSEHNETESPILNDIRKAVQISPKNKGIPILKKPNQPLILKKVKIGQQLRNTNVQNIQPTTSEHVTLFPIKSLPTTVSAKSTGVHLTTNFMPIAPKTQPVIVSSANPSTPNYKILKVIRSPTLAKPKDMSPVAVKLKSMEAYATMLSETRLVRFFKCMSRDCCYTTDSLTLYSEHYLQHSKEASKQSNASSHDYQKCAYCYTSQNDLSSMKTHLWEKHSYCRYQCGYCFYRAIVPSYVQQHQITCHPGSKFYYILGKTFRRIQKQEDINRSDYIKPFMCKHDCDKYFYIIERFIVHLKTKHSSSQRLYTCHLCNIKYTTIESFISHYKTHGYSKYQCLYCLHGTETLSEMHQHLSACHYNRLPQTIERSLPLTPTHNMDVINQLLLRTHFDEITKINEKIVDLNADGPKKAISMKDGINDQISTTPFNIEIALNQEHSNSTKTSVHHFVGRVSDNLSKSAESSANVTNISAKQSINVSFTDDITENTSDKVIQKQSQQNKLFVQSEKEKLTDYATKHILQESKLELLGTNDSNTIDSLEFSDKFNCSDEFVNTNLFDNAEFLKTLTINSGNTLFSKDDITTSADKTEDSDIEILENIENEKRNVKDNIKQIIDPKSSEPKIEVKEQSASCSTTENKCTSEKAPADTADMTAQPDKPLTLDDIKDTGRAGLELYKCGYLECSFAAQNVVLLKAHIKQCTFGEPARNLFCPHCKKRFIKIGFLLEHLKAHGLKRFGCSLCKMRYAVSYQATAHMKTKHKFSNTKLTPADPTNPSVDGLFIVHAVPFGSAERKTKKRKGTKSGMEQENEKTSDNEKLSFSPDEIEQLPRQAIYNREVQCAVCPYTTKVRTNIIRHLQLHAKDETVPESGPVNPVPCLDKKEKMFDKMVNLASSSHQNGRMGGKTKEIVQESEEDDNSIPKFVPEHKRYVCSVTECNYLTVDEAMLRYHLKALHSEEPYFRCPHCPPPSSGQENQNIAIDKMGVHLKMHDTRLYKCSHCNHHHYHRHVVERHLTDKHPEKRPFVKVIRELESTENVQQPVQEEAEEEVPDPDGNHWKCNLCDFKCVYKADIATHADTVHGENNQYKCTLCSFKTSGKILLEQHINGKHAYDSSADYILVYQRIKGVNKRNAEVIEQSVQDEPFDTTPLWRRSMPRIRHIRGILLEEEIEAPAMNETASATSKVSLGKRKNDAENSTKPAKIKSNGKSGSLDESNKQSKEKSKRSLSCEKLSGEAGGESQVTKEGAKNKLDSGSTTDSKSAKNSKTSTAELNDSDVGRFGPYGKPDGNMYICTLCNHFKTKYKHDMRDHLYRELNYARWHCKICGYSSVNRKALLQHFAKRHCGEWPENEALPPDNAIEDWVMTLLKKQTDMIKAASQNANTVNANKSVTTSVNTPATSSEDSNTISSKKTQANKKAVNLAPTISNLQNDILRDTNRSNIDTDDGDSRDNEDLVIDMKEDETLESRNNENMPENDKFHEKTEDVLEKPLVCKHCQMTFVHRRGFKLHVQLSHLKRLNFLCPYCDRSTNSETMMRQHIRSKHPNDPQKIIQNSSMWSSTKLTNEFWEKEYGLVCPLKSKKRKLNTEDASDSNISGNRVDMREKCEVCGFMAINYTGLKSHMRTHAAPKHSLKCMYCTYSCSFKAELLEHWEFNHPRLPFKFQELSSAAGPSSGEAKSTPSSPKKHKDIDMPDNVKEERAISADKPTPVIYCCSYCNLRSNSLSSLRRHWSIMHKESKEVIAANAKSNLPFRYKEISLPKLPKQYVSKNVESPRDHVEQSEALSSAVQQEYGWVCQWCQEFCKTDSDRITHQNMFHSHLPQDFKWQQQEEQEKEEEQLKSTQMQFSAYSAEKYASLATNSKSIPSFSVMGNLMASQARQSDFADITAKNESGPSRTLGTSKGGGGALRQSIAKKSTTKSVISYARPGPRIFKAVARKSTNPRYPPGAFIPRSPMPPKTEREAEKVQSKPFSYYGTSSSPINLAELSTYMVVGGHNMRVNCLTLATLININPRIILRDLKKDPKYAANFD